MIKKIVIGVALNAIALYAVTLLLVDIKYTGGFKFFLLSGLIIGFLNVFVKPLMKILSFPLMILTIGLFSLVINAIIFWLTMLVVNGIHLSDVSVTISGTSVYLIAGIVFGLMNAGLHFFIKNK
jgi:putative membrane protein